MTLLTGSFGAAIADGQNQIHANGSSPGTGIRHDGGGTPRSVTSRQPMTLHTLRQRRVPARAHRAGLGLLAAVMLTAGCGATTSPHPAPSTATVPLPPPSQNGPVITVQGDVTWGPACSLLRTGSGQYFSLVGPAAQIAMGNLRSGTRPAGQRVEITGYIPRVGATVCGSQRNFVAEKVTPMSK